MSEREREWCSHAHEHVHKYTKVVAGSREHAQKNSTAFAATLRGEISIQSLLFANVTNKSTNLPFVLDSVYGYRQRLVELNASESEMYFPHINKTY